MFLLSIMKKNVKVVQAQKRLSTELVEFEICAEQHEIFVLSIKKKSCAEKYEVIGKLVSNTNQ